VRNRIGHLIGYLWLLAAGCDGNAGVGATCSSHGDCASDLQCSTNDVCVPRCSRAPECGDGFACGADGVCEPAAGQPGDSCASETECTAGLSCQLDGVNTGDDRHLLASCSTQLVGRPANEQCEVDADCRNNTCALGRCVDLCLSSRDCDKGLACMDIPRIQASGALFAGCLPEQGNITWEVPVQAPTASILVPVPSLARSMSLVFSVADRNHRVGARSVIAPSARALFSPCSIFDDSCEPTADFFSQVVRHQPLFGQSTITLPTTPSVPLETGVYRVGVASYSPTGELGSAIPRVTASVRIGNAVLLDLHFHFLNLEDHMCTSALGGLRLDASTAQSAVTFQDDFLSPLRQIFAHGGIALGRISYDDILDHPELDGLDVADAGELLRLGTAKTGIDVYFVRTLSPVGLQAFGPNPGPTHNGTIQSGVVIALDTLCYRTWPQLSRLVAHELARYMGLHHNVEPGSSAEAFYQDTIDDTDDSPTNLMYFSEFGGTEISPDQREILTRSGVLR
jgi:hypothetical protein